MKVWTYGEVKDKVLQDLDMEEEDFVQADELVGYVNDAIDEAEAEILKLNEDYFIRSSTITLVQGTAEYSLPSDIYIQKIRALIFDDGSQLYTVRAVKELNRFLDIANTNRYSQSANYRYQIINTSVTDGYQLKLIPTARESGAYLTIHYIRNAQRVPLISEGTVAATEATRIDIPEWAPFIIEKVKLLCMRKDHDPLIPEQDKEVFRVKNDLIDTLSQRTPDEQSSMLEGDYTHYNEHT